MPRKVELVRESKLHALLKSENRGARLEASGVYALDDSTCLVVFDNKRQVARIGLSLEKPKANEMITVLSPTEGFESIAYDPEHQRYYLLVEAIKDVDGSFRGLVVEYDRNFEFQLCSRLETAFDGENKGFEGLAHVRRGDQEYLWALCEGNDCCSSEEGQGRVQVYRRGEFGRWIRDHHVKLPEEASFRDYADLSLRDRRVAVVSQKSRRLWIGELDDSWRDFRDGGVTYAFPSKAYRNVEGVSWLSDTRLAIVSDRLGDERGGGRAKKDQSIHIIDIPGRA